MSDATDEENDPDQADGDQDLPEMTEEDFADADLDALADEIEEEAGAEASAPIEAEAGGDQDTDVDGDQETDADGGGELDTDAETWGDMYVGTLTTVSNAIIEEHGTEDAEPIEEQLARDLHLDAYFNDFMDSRGKSDMPPEQALLIGTTMFLVVIIGSKTDLPSELMEEAEI